MPPKQNRVQGGNARSRASAVPQGDRQRRARQDFEGERDQPAATNIRAESQQPQWTMSSSVEDILLEGSTNRNNMKLNDFLRSYLGEEWVVERNGNVTMEAFVQEPDAYVQDQQLLRRIVNLTAYQTLKILLEAINKLHHEGVYSLEQWRDYEGKDTVTPVARRKLNAAISRVLTEERRKAEERREAEERARRDQQQIIFNLSAMIEDLLFGGRVRVHKMKLNDFLTMEFDGRGILRANRCVWLGDFFKDPTRYIRDAGVLNEIQATGAYARMEMTVREEMDLEEDVHRLHHEGVYSLEQWRDYEGKDTVTPVARRKINAAISRVLTEERRKAEERRETKERASRRQKLELTVTTTIKDVLFRGRVRVMDIQLNDFLVMELDGMGILPANRNVLLKEFVKDSTRYICGAFLLLEIKASDRYKRMERAVRDEMDMEEDVNKLYEKGVDNLLKWSLAAEEVKANVHNLTKHFLDAAFIELMSSMTMSAPMKLEGCYESVYNARWHHVVEVPGGKGAGMYVREGEPEQSWKYKEVGEFLEKDDGVEQSGAARPRLMVLTSDRGWPYSWKEDESTRDCYVNSEVERVWRIVRNDLTEWFSPHRGTYFTPKQRLLIGTPGIGKSLAAGSYLLYQLLHYDAEQLPMVAYVIGSQSFLFDKTTKTVSTYRDNPRIEDVVNIFFFRGVKGYCIYDATLACRQPSAGLPCKGWGMIVVTPPDKNEYERWKKKMDATAIVTNCPEENDVRAMCIWMKRNRPLQEQAEYWKEVRGRMNNVGPILRSIFDKQAYDDRIKACQQAVDGSTASELERNLGIGCCYLSNDNDLSRKLVKVVRVRRGNNIESPLNLLVSPHLERETLSRLENEMKQSDFIFFVLRFWDYVPPYLIEKYAVSAFLNEEFLRAIRLKIKELRPPGRREPHSCALKEHSDTSFTRKEVLPPPERLSNPVAMDHWVLYEPKVQHFPLVDGFFFVDSNPMTLVGLRMTTAGEHRTTTSTVRQFTECLAAYFNGWEELSRDMSWDIINVQHADNMPMNGWRRCDVVNSDNVSRAENREIAAFWEEEVRQYIAAVSSGDFGRDEAL
ncbi:putative retrotransposon hot spot (RHS) protein [Trypanosoma cruzi]|uniref:Retrotransposon hot spot (RHS) protein, putative n=2 Tax=Trypanosoma cruzi TaxID=5693 RepID=Q4DQ04_TRYCC|nr:retrotransposon hot spot (RHS) protein, putative [Trypanosoma cruzi]EAN94606.1 retrotransposon hot spot (RHS) protein, putative [Trypanosoma cruzi]PWU97391.1 putative retrotransposon hot spot (RHS) protein [Trypanosoma cruzi]|eukprot:XP_816457.1 retrotransposon hot spot (RHS) protein [Trypanosoma cruzi strain CL Brener]